MILCLRTEQLLCLGLFKSKGITSCLNFMIINGRIGIHMRCKCDISFTKAESAKVTINTIHYRCILDLRLVSICTYKGLNLPQLSDQLKST